MRRTAGRIVLGLSTCGYPFTQLAVSAVRRSAAPRLEQALTALGVDHDVKV